MTFGYRGSLNLLNCNIWAEFDCATNLATDYHKLINYEVMMCPSGLLIPISETVHIVFSEASVFCPVYKLPHIHKKKRKKKEL